MPSTVTYWQLSDDENDFINFLQSTGSVLALPAYWAEEEREMVPEPITFFMEKHDPSQFLFGLEEYVLSETIERRVFDGRPRYGINQMKSCLINYRRGKVQGVRLPQSNINAYPEYPTEDASRMLIKDERFLGWANSVISWIRKATPERVELNGHSYRATRRVKTAVLASELEPVLY